MNNPPTLIRNPIVHVVRCVDAHGQPPNQGMPWIEQGQFYEVAYATTDNGQLKVMILQPAFAGFLLSAQRFEPVADYCLN